MHYKDITFTEVKNLLNENTILIDVRSSEEWQQHNLCNSVNIPLSDIELDKVINLCSNLCEEKNISRDKSINLVFYCRSGVRSLKAIDDLLDDEDMEGNILLVQDYKLIIYNLKGGINGLNLYINSK